MGFSGYYPSKEHRFRKPKKAFKAQKKYNQQCHSKIEKGLGKRLDLDARMEKWVIYKNNLKSFKNSIIFGILAIFLTYYLPTFNP